MIFEIFDCVARAFVLCGNQSQPPPPPRAQRARGIAAAACACILSDIPHFCTDIFTIHILYFTHIKRFVWRDCPETRVASLDVCESETPYSYLIPNKVPIIVNIYQTNLHVALIAHWAHQTRVYTCACFSWTDGNVCVQCTCAQATQCACQCLANVREISIRTPRLSIHMRTPRLVFIFEILCPACVQCAHALLVVHTNTNERFHCTFG